MVNKLDINTNIRFCLAAQILYMGVANRWYMKQYNNLNDPTNDCLGIARTVICSYSFSKCFEGFGDVVI